MLRTSTYGAIMMAADHIEKHPELFSFYVNGTPECGHPRCALGWIFHFANVHAAPTHFSDEEELLGMDLGEFLSCMDDMGRSWHHDHKQAALCLRIFAERYAEAEVA